MFRLPKPQQIRWNQNALRGEEARQAMQIKDETHNMQLARHRMMMAKARQAQAAQAAEQKRKEQRDANMKTYLDKGALEGVTDTQRQFLYDNPAIARQMMVDRMKGRLTPFDPIKTLKRKKAELELRDMQGNAANPSYNKLMSAVTGLEQKIGKENSTQEDAFESATGPIADSLVGRTFSTVVGALDIPNVFGEIDDLTLLQTIKQDSQAVKALLQRALLKGGGSITENEREQVNQILGEISTARNAAQARELVRNFKTLVGGMFGSKQGTEDPLGIR